MGLAPDADEEGSALQVGHALLEHARQVDVSFPSAEYLAAAGLTADVDATVLLGDVPTEALVAAEDLIVTKILAGRDKDKEDVRAVVRAGQATLKLDTIRTTIAMLEEALGQSDLMPLFEELLTQATARRG